MRANIVSPLVLFAAAVAGLQITAPIVNQNVDNSKSVTVKWHAVESVLPFQGTDPETFSIYLVNQNVYPPTQELVASDVPKDKGSYTINAKSMDGVDTGHGYQVNFVSDTDNQAILAQSGQFKVADHSDFTSSSVFYFLVDCFLYHSDHYSHLHQCVYPNHFFIYCFTYYFYPYFIFYDDLYYQCVNLFLLLLLFVVNIYHSYTYHTHFFIVVTHDVYTFFPNFPEHYIHHNLHYDFNDPIFLYVAQFH
ncbi:hypothetical protein N7532_008583 [Penicillium argentinense]|uniref:Yeast cell wall synthesis Kre9/Knh1-like N-terminal domain-containing protein n=1 Tax=Penicillium argentinense TaxID=1131581 RepID=A0A9W9EXN8_9EURO|nr:uncharacterized protein N7532_008583 [Penicillium argentinense]KAJ5089899.1 hypothetical protein N7532_008583 [Penicillium argentinense]